MSNGSRYLEVIYCDDIREEVGNKFSYMGVYSGELTVPNAPVLLSKLCVVAKVITDIDHPFESLEVRIVMGQGDDETEILSTGSISLPAEMPKQHDDSNRLMAQMTFMLTPFQINKETILRVKAITESEELRGTTALRICIVPPAPLPTIQ